MNQLLHIGTYTQRGAEGIYTARFDAVHETLELCGVVARVGNPSFLAVSPCNRFLYTVGDIPADAGGPGGVYAYRIVSETGTLQFLNRQPMHGARGCHVAVDHSGTVVLVANYADGNVSVFPVKKDGSLEPRSDFHQHHGRGANLRRQEKAHAHSVTLSPDNRFAFVADLGTDKIMVYRLDTAGRRLVPNDPPFVALHPGAGPRHFAFHPSGRWAYVVNELDSSVTTFAYDATQGALRPVQTVSALPKHFEGESIAADIHVAASGRFIYASNRGHDTIAIFSFNPENGTLHLLGHEPTRGKTPRNFVITPEGKHMLVANQDSDNVVLFRLDIEQGLLAPTGAEICVSMPVCLVF
ncbi:MAG: lactonase family protein [Kiritimatiellae bacterium]|nr:lactonase family protein [Kiritimatiellia bacterium]